jgi:cytochrome c-type biogenesis protein CcmH
MRRAISTPLFFIVVLAIGAAAWAQEGNLDQRVFEIAHQLRCPVCVSESVADSSSRVAIEMRDLIQQQLEEGKTEAEILAFFRDRYGDWILLEPPRQGIHLLVWLLPVVVLLAGGVGLGLFIRRWLRAGRDTPEVDSAELSRVREAMAEREYADSKNPQLSRDRRS